MKRVFISFRHEDKPQVNGLRLLAANDKFNIEFYDESVQTAINSQNATYIKSKISEKIGRTSVTLCMVSALTYTSEWVDWELETSFAKGNKLIFMGFKNGPETLRLPALAKQLNLPWYLWDHDHLARLIEAK
ncbi:TIR domain-containing protein [Bradyrhizobium japonicum]|uniref:TIR domain-containing protein n=1 Tax=Bradyrhizobium japonicum TaxID=375 RepID=UPI001BAE3AF7|nr:TIR domain-containing protein [Bradyrhizobium japonicum]MBR0734675.1 TIR domain-containing protein [Bradyrhizobium japonicum]